jgi:hypothetical protein
MGRQWHDTSSIQDFTLHMRINELFTRKVRLLLPSASIPRCYLVEANGDEYEEKAEKKDENSAQTHTSI